MYRFIDEYGSFYLENPELTSYLYFPLANEVGMKSCVTPTLNGDAKTSQNTFLLEPVSSENLHNNKSSRNFWLRINNKEAWSVVGASAWQQSKIFSSDKEQTTLRAGMMWHELTRFSKEHGLKATITSFVPALGMQVEVMIVDVENIGTESVNVTPIAAIPLYARSADNLRDHRNVSSMLHRVEVTSHGVYVNPTLTFDERGHQINEVVYGVIGGCADEKPVCFYPIVENFLGEGGSFENPRAVVCHDVEGVIEGYKGAGYEVVGALEFANITLNIGESKRYIVVMGIAESQEELEKEARKYLFVETAYATLEETKHYWQEKVNITYKSGDQSFDSFMKWVSFQPMLRRIYGCSFLPHHDYGKGGRGWRDLWQDCLALLVMNPSGVRQMIIDNFGGVRLDGTNATIIGTKQGEFIADRNHITRVWMDHGAWPFITTRLYMMQSGDMDLLLEKQTYFKDTQVSRGEEKDILWQKSDDNLQRTTGDNGIYKGTLLEHMLLQHLTAFYDVGEHNEMRLRGADWNDALDMADERGESVAFTALYAGNLNQMANMIADLREMKGIHEIELAEEMALLLTNDTLLYESVEKKQALLKAYEERVKHHISGNTIRVESKALEKELKQKAKWMIETIRKNEWLINKEGYAWFNSYYDNHGRKVEGDFEQGARIMLTGQVFSIMANVATDVQIKEIVKTVNYYLYDETVGGYRLNTNFHEVKADLGRMFGFAYGQKENGSVFSHMAIMYAYALYERGFYKEGYKAVSSLYKHCLDFTKSRIYPGIPEYIDPSGRGVYHYLTGSASWLLLTVLTKMFGVKGYYGDLYLEPHLLLEQFDDLGIASVMTNFNGIKLKVTYHNPSRREVGEYKIEKAALNGKTLKLTDEKLLIKKELLESLGKEQVQNIEVTLV